MIELVLIVLFTKWVVKAFMSSMLIRIQSSYEIRKKNRPPFPEWSTNQTFDYSEAD